MYCERVSESTLLPMAMILSVQRMQLDTLTQYISELSVGPDTCGVRHPPWRFWLILA